MLPRLPVTETEMSPALRATAEMGTLDNVLSNMGTIYQVRQRLMSLYLLILNKILSL